MHYYVLAGDPESIVPRHILAEVVRDISEDPAQRGESLAGLLSGPHSSILTLDELLDLPGGREMLRAWHNGTDINFYLESVRQERDDKRATRRHLSLVEDMPDVPDTDASERAAHLIKQAAWLQLHSAELVARAEALKGQALGRLPDESSGRRGAQRPPRRGFEGRSDETAGESRAT